MKPRNTPLKNLLLAAMFLAIGLVLPFFTGQIKEIGNMLLPMHLPVFLCALICGWQYGTAVGFIMPILRFALFFMPRMPAPPKKAANPPQTRKNPSAFRRRGTFSVSGRFSPPQNGILPASAGSPP